jgi:hypothetical protein
MALVSQVVSTTRDGCTLTEVYDDASYDDAAQAYQITSVSASNPTGGNGFPARTLTVWVDYKGKTITTSVPAGQVRTWTPNGNRSIADVSGCGLD